MAKNELNPSEIQSFLENLSKSDGAKSDAYEAPEELKKDDAKTVDEILKDQIPTHRRALLILVCSLTVASFLLLAFIVVFQMLWPIRHPNFEGVSDRVINILSVGVFAELVGVVGVIVKLVWKKPK